MVPPGCISKKAHTSWKHCGQPTSKLEMGPQASQTEQAKEGLSRLAENGLAEKHTMQKLIPLLRTCPQAGLQIPVEVVRISLP